MKLLAARFRLWLHLTRHVFDGHKKEWQGFTLAVPSWLKIWRVTTYLGCTCGRVFHGKKFPQ